jgi:hypothetical protein
VGGLGGPCALLDIVNDVISACQLSLVWRVFTLLAVVPDEALNAYTTKSIEFDKKLFSPGCQIDAIHGEPIGSTMCEAVMVKLYSRSPGVGVIEGEVICVPVLTPAPRGESTS